MGAKLSLARITCAIDSLFCSACCRSSFIGASGYFGGFFIGGSSPLQINLQVPCYGLAAWVKYRSERSRINHSTGSPCVASLRPRIASTEPKPFAKTRSYFLAVTVISIFPGPTSLSITLVVCVGRGSLK